MSPSGLYPLEGVLDPLVASSGNRIVLLRMLRDSDSADAFMLAGSTGILDVEVVRRSMTEGLVAAGYAAPKRGATPGWSITDDGRMAAAAIDPPQVASLVVREETIRFDLVDGYDRPDVEQARAALDAFGNDVLSEVADNATRDLLAEAGRDRALMGQTATMLAGVRLEVDEALDVVEQRWPASVTSVVADIERSGWDVTWAARVVAHTSMAEQLGLKAQTIPHSRPLMAEAAKRLRALADRLDPKPTGPADTPISGD